MNQLRASREIRQPHSESGDLVPIALALLEHAWPESPALADATGPTVLSALRDDPRYLIGRLTQALTVLLARDLPPMDAATALLSEALADAIAWRQHRDRPPCSGCAGSLCDQCAADWDQADRYHLLALTLGAVGDTPGTRGTARPRLDSR
jgi:hypothetical protein